MVLGEGGFRERALRLIRRLTLFSTILLIFLIFAGYAGDTGNAIADWIAMLAFFILLIVAFCYLAPWLYRVFPHGVGYGSIQPAFENQRETLMYYPPVYRKVPFGILVVLFIIVVYVAHVRSSLPIVQAGPIEQEALGIAVGFVVASVIFVWSVFVWIYSAFYRVTPEGFQWVAPWSRKRFVRWDEVRSVWYVPWLGKGIWVRTSKGRFRVDFDMVNASAFMDYVLKHTQSGIGLNRIKKD